jgi:hypothetical protein
LASKPEDQILAPLLHALLIRPDGILGRIAPDPAYKVDEQQTRPAILPGGFKFRNEHPPHVVTKRYSPPCP